MIDKRHQKLSREKVYFNRIFINMVIVTHFLGELIRFSQQALMDCSWGFGNNACDGGEDFRVYQFMMKHGGIPTEDSYGPYLGNDGFCHMNASNIEIGLQIKGYVNVTSGILNLFFATVKVEE